MGTRWRRIVTYTVTVACAAVAGVLLVAHHSGTATPRARQYLGFSACLLTGSRGLAGPQAAQAWSGMQAASLATRAKVEYLPAMGPQTTAAALPFLAGLIQRDCNVIIAVGQAPVAAVSQDAPLYPAVSFAVVGGQAGPANVTAVNATLPIGPAVQRLVTSAVQASGTS
jgi:basic membrane lipoprotein Med (substrate-binding protein (PBP1-ABC) superfamily)